MKAEVHGSEVRLQNVRNFEWRSETDYTPRWESRTYNLDCLSSADLILSYWMGPHIAHTLVSFEFDGGERLVFSLEIRKERHESLSAIGDFFRQFEQVLMAADERDIVRTRSNARGEDVYLYRLWTNPAHLRRLFLDYVDAANETHRAPWFYNTLVASLRSHHHQRSDKAMRIMNGRYNRFNRRLAGSLGRPSNHAGPVPYLRRHR